MNDRVPILAGQLSREVPYRNLGALIVHMTHGRKLRFVIAAMVNRHAVTGSRELAHHL